MNKLKAYSLLKPKALRSTFLSTSQFPRIAHLVGRRARGRRKWKYSGWGLVCTAAKWSYFLSLRTKHSRSQARPHFPRVNEHTDVSQEALLVSIVFSHFEIIFVIHLPNKIKGQSKTKTKFTCASSSLSGFNYHFFFDKTKKSKPERCSIVTFDVLPSGGVSGSLHVYASTACLYGMFTVAGTVW